MIVVSGATHRAGMVDEYEAQLKAEEIPFHLEMVEPMPYGPNSMTMKRKAEFVRRMADKFWNYRAMYITDAWDVLLCGTRLKLSTAYPDLLFSAERNAYPESDVTPADTLLPWKYCNAGCLGGRVPNLFMWADRALREDDLDLLDQAWLNRRLNTSFAPIDFSTRMFYTVSANHEDGALTAKHYHDKLSAYNQTTGNFPSFLHFSGGCPSNEVRGILGWE